jgi:NitT/TauT family transport system permease protein
MYASRDGFGHHIASWGENFQMPQLFAGVLFLAILAIILNEAIRLVEQRCSHWRQ